MSMWLCVSVVQQVVCQTRSADAAWLCITCRTADEGPYHSRAEPAVASCAWLVFEGMARWWCVSHCGTAVRAVRGKVV